MAGLPKVGVELTAENANPFFQAVEKGNQAVAKFGQTATQSAKSTGELAAATQRALKITDLTDKIGLQNTQLGRLQKELGEAAQKYGESSSQALKKKEAVDALDAKIKSGERSLAAYQEQIQQEYQAQQRATQAAEQAVPANQRLESSIREVSQVTTTSARETGIWENVLTGATQRVGQMITNMLADAGRALIGFGVDAVTLAGDYESTLNRFSSVTGSSLADAGFKVDDFSKLFLKLGADTQFSAQQAADAGVELAKGGVPIEQIMGDATEATLALAAAGELELAPAAAIVAKQLGVWGDTGVTATDAANLLAQAANASTVDVDELALGMANVGGTAKVAGVSFQETVQAMALLAPGFSSAADAGTSFKTFLTKLIPKTKDEVGMMQQLGLYTEKTGSVFYDATGNFIGMEKASDLLADATDHLSEEQKLLAFHTIFGADAIRAAAIIAEKGGEGFDAMGESMTAAGTASAQAAERNKGFNFAMESLKGSLETIQIILGTAVLPTLTAFINDVIIPGANSVMTFATALGSANDPLDFLVASFGRLLSNLGPIGTMFQSLINIFIRGQDTFANWTFLERSLGAVGDQLANLGMKMLSWVGEMLPIWGERLAALGERAWQWIVDALPGIGDKLGEVFNFMVNWVVSSLPGWIEHLKLLGMQAIQWVQDALPGLGTNLGQFAGKLLSWIGETAMDVVPKLAELGGKFLSWIATDVLPELPTTLKKIGEAILNFLGETAIEVGPKITELSNRFYAWVEDEVIPKLPGELLKIATAIGKFLDDTVNTITQAALNLGSAIIDGITEGVKAAAGRLYDATVGAIWNAISGAQTEIDSHSPSQVTFDLIGTPFMDGITSGVLASAPALTEAVIGSLTTAMDAGQMIAQTGATTIGETLGGISSAAQIAAFQAAMGSVRPAQGGLGEFGSGGGHRIQPVMTPSQIGSQMSITNNGPQISYAPTYNSPAPPPALDFGTLQALTGGL